MNSQQVKLVQSSFELVRPMADTAAHIFYDRLFTLDPSLRPLFKGDMAAHGRMLMSVLGVAVKGLTDLDALAPVLRGLGARHVEYGVRDEHYITVGTALLWTLEQGLGEAFTADVREAWTEAYGLLADVMQLGALESQRKQRNDTEASERPMALADYDTLTQALHQVARRVGAGDPAAETGLRTLMAQLDGHPDARCVGLYVFAAALAKRLHGHAAEQANLYLSRFEVPQIHLFNLLGRAVPFVGMATRICNDAIMRAIDGQLRPTLIDVGIGTGRQACLLLQSLADAGKLPDMLTVIGIEPSDWALMEARRNIEDTAQRLGANVSFFAVEGTIETLSTSDWRRMVQACTARPVVNASFALHHIADAPDGADQRGPVLQRLRGLNPEALILAEPDVDHLETHFYTRFSNCLAHFGAVFRTLDHLPLAQADRDALKVGFFGREIADILGGAEAQRSERHERAASWMRRLGMAGFACHSASALPGLDESPVRMQHRAGYLSLDAVDEPVVAIFLAKPKASPVVTTVQQAAEAVY